MISHVHLKGTQHTGSQKVQHLLQLLQQGPGSCSLFNRTNFSLVHKETTKRQQHTGSQKVHHLLQLLQQVPGSCRLFNKTTFTHVHRETATYRKPGGASPAAAVAAATWQLQPFRQDTVLSCAQKKSSVQEHRRCISFCSCCSRDLAAAACSTGQTSHMYTTRQQHTGSHKVHHLLELLQQGPGSCRLPGRLQLQLDCPTLKASLAL